MTKKLSAIALIVLLTANFAYAQKLEISGEMKTGFFWERVDVDGKKSLEAVKMHSNDDAGGEQGRFRLNLHVHNEYNMGMKARFQQETWTGTPPTQFAYAMGYGNFIDNQLRVTIGKLGESPWGAGGPDLWSELDNQVGIRTEVMPKAIPGLDIGVVLNGWNGTKHNLDNGKVDNLLLDILQETVFGIAYTNDYFHGRFSWRLDGDVDSRGFPSGPVEDVQEGMEMIYRLEERIIRKYLPGFSIWANGYWAAIGEDSRILPNDASMLYSNYLYFDYSPPAFSSRLTLGLLMVKDVQTFVGRAAFYYNIFPFLSAGAAANYRQLFGKRAPDDGKSFLVWGIEPQVKVTFNPNAYVAFVYNYGQQWATLGQGDRILQDRQWINIRAVYTF